MIRFLKVGKYLHLSALVGVYLSYLSINKLFNTHNYNITTLNTIIWLFLFIYGLGVLIIAELDVRGRYQNYKQVKEKFYKYGCNGRIIKLYMYSNCQRNAVRVAGSDLGFYHKINKYFFEKGYRWYHILPDVFVENPLVIFTKYFWVKILFTKYYPLQNFYW